MILTVLIYIVIGFIQLLILILPTGSGIPAEVWTMIHDLIANMLAWAWFFPVGDLLSALAIALTIDGFFFAWDGIHWLLKKLPFLHIK